MESFNEQHLYFTLPRYGNAPRHSRPCPRGCKATANHWQLLFRFPGHCASIAGDSPFSNYLTPTAVRPIIRCLPMSAQLLPYNHTDAYPILIRPGRSGRPIASMSSSSTCRTTPTFVRLRSQKLRNQGSPYSLPRSSTPYPGNRNDLNYVGTVYFNSSENNLSLGSL